MARFGFAPAQAEETIVYGAQRPGYPSRSVGPGPVREWLSYVSARGIHRICCLLPQQQLDYYELDLLAEYRAQFGPSNVCSAAVRDYHLCDPDVLSAAILPFLAASDEARWPVVVHCSGGSGRTGHILAAWLVRHRGLTGAQALAAVEASGRNPREAVQCGNATEEELRGLIRGERE